METAASLSWMSSSSASSSSTSSPWPQTPDTPSILGVLHAQQVGYSASPGGTSKVAAEPVHGFESITEWRTGSEPPTASQAIPVPIDLPSSPGSPMPNGDEDAQPFHTGQDASGSSTRPDIHRSQSSLRASLKRKLERSKHSFRSLGSTSRRAMSDRNSSRDGDSRSGGSQSGSISDLTDVDQRPRTGRLRSLFHRTRGGESQRSAPADPVLLSASPEQPETSTVPFETPASIADTSSPSVIVRDFGGLHQGVDYFSIRLLQQETPDMDEVEEMVKVRPSKGKARAIPRTEVSLAAPVLSHSALPRQALHARSSSLPEFDVGLEKFDVEGNIAYFDRRLPHELKIEVFRHLIDSHWPATGNQRWSGAVQGRRELIRISRVRRGLFDSRMLGLHCRCPSRGDKPVSKASCGHCSN